MMRMLPASASELAHVSVPGRFSGKTPIRSSFTLTAILCVSKSGGGLLTCSDR